MWIMIAYSLCYMPTLTLTNSISFRNLSNPDKQFGSIRVLGTIGWIVAGWIVGFLINNTSPVPLYLAAGASVEASMKFTCEPVTVSVNAALGGLPGAMVTTLFAVVVPAAFDAASVTVYAPGTA